MEQELEILKRRRNLVIVGSIVFVIVVVFIGVVINLIEENKYNTAIENQDALSENISTADTNRLKQEIERVVRNVYDLDDDVTIETKMRASTYTETAVNNGTNVEFLIDVESVKATYKVWLLKNSDSEIDIALSCAGMDETNYPDNFCIGTDNHSTIDVTLENKLPYTGRVGNTIYAVSHTPYKAELEVYVNSCGNEEIINQTRESVKAWISEQGYNADMYPITIPEDNCYESNNN